MPQTCIQSYIRRFYLKRRGFSAFTPKGLTRLKETGAWER